MKINANSLRVGNVIDLNNKLWVITKTQVVQPGKGGAFMQVELRDVRGGGKGQERFRSAEQVERVSLEDREFQFLYPEGEGFAFMDVESYEQMTINKDVVGDQWVWLQDGMKVNIRLFEGAPLAVELPQTVVQTVAETDPAVKGQTAASSYKPGKLDNGQRCMIPPHIESGTRIVVNVEDGTYLERYKD